MELVTRFKRSYKYLVPAADRDKHDVLENYFNARDFAVRDELNNNYWHTDSYETISRFPPSNCLHEVIFGQQPQKIRFDIDCPMIKLVALDVSKIIFPAGYYYDYLRELQEIAIANLAGSEIEIKKEFLTKIFCEIISMVFRRDYDEILITNTKLEVCDFAITDQSDEHKFSRHIILYNYSVSNNSEVARFAMAVESSLPEVIRDMKIVDMGVYKKNQCFRLIGCFKAVDKDKANKRIKKLMTLHSPEETLITKFPLTVRVLPDLCKEEKKVKRTANETNDVNVQSILQAATPYTNGLTFSGVKNNIINLKRIERSLCAVCNVYHDNIDSYIVTKDFTSYLCCFRMLQYGGKRVLLQTRPNVTDDTIPDNFTTHYIDEKFMPEISFHHEGKEYNTLLIRSQMGSGKSARVRSLVDTVPQTTNIIYLSFRKTFTQDVLKNLPDFTAYNNVEGLLNQKRLIVQYESLHRIDLKSLGETLLILDESESIVSQLENQNNKRIECWLVFKHILKNAKKCIMLDAFAGNRSFSLCKERGNVLVVINKNKEINADKIDKIHMNEKTYNREFSNALNNINNEKFLLCVTTLKEANAKYEYIRQNYPDIKVAFYHQNMSEQMRAELNDVNESWIKRDVLIYTPSVGAGVSFDVEHFSRVFGYFSPKSADFLSCIQMLGRCRKTKGRYDIFVKRHKGNYPNSEESVESAIDLLLRNSQAKTIAGVDVNVNPDLFELDDTLTRYVYKNKDLYYHLHSQNILHQCRSKNNFLEWFMHHREAMGVRCEIVQPDNEFSALFVETKKIERQLFEQTILNIVNANVNINEEINAVNNNVKKELTVEEKNKADKLQLCEFYGVDTAAITVDFVKKYGSDKVKSEFSNLKLINKYGLQEAIKLSSYLDPKLPDLSRSVGMDIHLCSDIINHIFPDFYTSKNKFPTLRLQRENFKIKLKEKLSSLLNKNNYFKLSFNIDINTLISKLDSDNFRVITREFNKLITPVLGLEIISINNKRKKHPELEIRLDSLFKIINNLEIMPA